MDKEKFLLVNSLIMTAAHLAGLTGPHNRSGFDGGYGIVWSWRWLDAPDPVIAGVEVSVLPDDAEKGAEIKVRSAYYDYDDRDKSDSRLYWGRYIEYKDLVLDEKVEDITNEVKDSLSLAWQDLSQQVASLPKIVEERRALMAKLRNMGLLQE